MKSIASMQDTNLLEDQPVAWTPTPDVIENARLTQFMRQIGVSTWDQLYAHSINDVEMFTAEVLQFLDINFDPPYDKLLDTSEGVEFPTWFGRSADTPVRMPAKQADSPLAQNALNSTSDLAASGDADKSVRAPSAGLNITTVCLDRWIGRIGDQPAVIWEGEEGGTVTLTYKEVLANVDACVEKLCDLDIHKGDAVGIHLPMIPETVVSLLAINRVGAIAVPVFSGYGIDAITSRMEAVGAKALITCDGFPRRGKPFDMLTVAARAVANCPTIKGVMLVERSARGHSCPLDAETDHVAAREDRRRKFERYEYLRNDVFSGRQLAQWNVATDAAAEPSTPEKTLAEDPLIILYTSGTTGKPKGIAHTHASFPIKAAQDMAFGTDVGVGTRISWYTDIGWMMGPWLIYGALINGGTICIYDGAPDFPTADRMWEFCAKHRVEILGISPTLIRALARSADTPVRIGVASTPTETVPNKKRGWYRHKLPHFDGDVTQFVTFRLADSLPQDVLERLRAQVEHDKHTDHSEEFRAKVEEYLDAGAGECLLRDPALAELVEDAILYEHGKSCDLKAWVVMPNHAHVLLRPFEGHDLAGIMKRIKGVSARKINQALGREGTVWQADYFDRYIRDEDDYLRRLAYIEHNPVAAGFVNDPADWQFSSSRSADTPVRMPAKQADKPLSQSALNSPDDLAGGTGRSADTPVRMPAKQADIPSHSGSFSPTTDLAGGTGDADMSVRAPFERHDLSSLRAFASTGEPWNPAPWWWLFEKVGNSKLPIINYSGGTEIAGGILMGNPLLPIKPCSFPAPCPGMDVDILDEEGNPVESGKVGELVIKQPWIGMARGFWQEKERYLDTYWRRFKNIWVHGDWAMRDADGHWFILGRSDDTLKVAGKRVGPAEVESILVSHPAVTEAAVIGIPDEAKGTAMIAFVVQSADTPVRMPAKQADKSSNQRPSSSTGDLAGGNGDADKSVRSPSLDAELKQLVADQMGKPLAPSAIHFVTALPKTRNAKVMRRVIRSAYLGEDPGDLSALEDPPVVNEIAAMNAGK